MTGRHRDHGDLNRWRAGRQRGVEQVEVRRAAVEAARRAAAEEQQQLVDELHNELNQEQQ